jgi:hypothetical protein
MLSKRSKGVFPPGSSPGGITSVDCFGLLIEFSACPVLDECEEVIDVTRQLLIGQATASDAGQDFREAATITLAMLALVVSKGLLVQVAEQMEGFDTDVGSLQSPLQQRPEVLNAISMYVTFNILFGMIDELVNIIFLKAGIGCQFVSEHFGTRFNIRAHFFMQRAALAIRDVLHAHFAGFAIQQTHYQLFARPARARDFFSLLGLVHIAGEAANHGFVGFDRTISAELLKSSALHSEPNPMQHEPRCFLTNLQIARDFARANPVLAVADQPDSRQPLGQRQRRILEDSSNLNRELSPVVFLATFPAALIGKKVDLIASACRTFHNTIRPTARNHISDTAVLLREIADRVRQVVGNVAVCLHASNLVHGHGLVKSIFTLIWAINGLTHQTIAAPMTSGSEVKAMHLATLRDVNIRYGNFHRRLHSTLENLEYLLEPKKPLPDTTSLGILSSDIPSLISGVSPASSVKQTLLDFLATEMDTLKEEAKEIGLRSTAKRVGRVIEHIGTLNSRMVEQYGDETLKHDIRVLRECLDDDLKERVVFYPSEANVNEWLLPNPGLFEKVYLAFPSAKSDLSWAKYSLITDNWTACVFYLMRSIEHVMRVLAVHLGIKTISKKTKIPLEYAQWGVVCSALEARIKKLQQTKTSKQKSGDLKFYADAASQINWFNEIWRKNVSHSRMLYVDSDADNAMRRAKDFLQLLSTRLKED